MRAKEKKRIARDKKPSAKLNMFASSPRSTMLDYFTNMAARTGYGTPSIGESATYEMVRLSNNYELLLTLYRNHWIARRIVDIPAIDMTRAWPKITSDIPPDDIASFDRTIEQTRTPRAIRRAIKWARLYGGGGALMVISGHEKYLEEPLDTDDVNPGTYRGLIPFDRWVGIYPTGQLSEDMEHPARWDEPEFYEVRGSDTSVSFRVHSSRVLRFLGPEVPTPEYQAQMYWGISELEVSWEELRKRDNASFAILNLLFRANLIAQTNPELAQMLSGLGTSQQALQRFWRTMEAQNQLISNQSMLLLGKDGDMKAVQYSFSGIGEVYAQFQMDVAGAAGMTVTRLFGRTITGLGQTNDADERLYEERIATDQHGNLTPELHKLYPVIAMSEWGNVPDDLNFNYPSVRVLTEEEKADMADKGSAPVIAAYNSAIIGRKTALKEFKQLSDTTGVFTNVTDEIIDKASDEPELMGGEDPEAEGAPGGDPGSKARANPQRMEKQLAAGAEDAARVRKWINWHGCDVTIENPVGSTRSGMNDLQMWSVVMKNDYGYLQRTKGADGDQVDCFVGDDSKAKMVYVVNTMQAPDFRDFDEQKCFLDFPSEAAARTAFFANYDRPEYFGSLEAMPVEMFIAKYVPSKDRDARQLPSVA